MSLAQTFPVTSWRSETASAVGQGVPGGDLPHVMVLRSLRDCRASCQCDLRRSRCRRGRSFIAMEAAASLFGRGLWSTSSHQRSTRSRRCLGENSQIWFWRAHAGKGVSVHLGSRVARIEDKQVLLQGGERIDADIVVVGIGVEPRLQFAEAAGLNLDRGVLVNSGLQSSDPTSSPQATLPAGRIPILAKASVWNIGLLLSARVTSLPRIC